MWSKVVACALWAAAKEGATGRHVVSAWSAPPRPHPVKCVAQQTLRPAVVVLVVTVLVQEERLDAVA